jgi:hypothetical protein
VSLPAPVPGLVVRYAYLWKREHDAGLEEGAKDRPCAILLAVRQERGDAIVTVLPITRQKPLTADESVEIPAETKKRLGLDDQQSWIVLSEANRFVWPGPDLRPLPGQGAMSVALGLLPRRLFLDVRDRFLALHRRGRAGVVPRSS